MKRLFLTLALIVSLASVTYAGEGIERGITPYGDYCPLCSNYGMCKRQAGYKEAISAVKEYFESKGLTIKNIRRKGRFIKVDIYRDKKLVDRVIFDRKTGRLRSIY